MKGATVSAWGGYIKAKNLTLEPARRIVQSRLTTRFPNNDRDSQFEVLPASVPEGTRITLQHVNVPDGHAGCQVGGWQQHDFEPMKQYC